MALPMNRLLSLLRTLRESIHQISNIIRGSGHCYDKVREATRVMQESMGDDSLNYNVPRKEVTFLYEGEEAEQVDQEKEVFRVDAHRPHWFPRHLLRKN